MAKMKPAMVSAMLAAGILTVPFVVTGADSTTPATPSAPAAAAVEPIRGLMPDELAQIAILIKNDKRIKVKQVLDLRVLPDNKVQVRTGIMKDAFSVSGELVTLQKQNERWAITNVLRQDALE